MSDNAVLDLFSQLLQVGPCDLGSLFGSLRHPMPVIEIPPIPLEPVVPSPLASRRTSLFTLLALFVLVSTTSGWLLRPTQTGQRATRVANAFLDSLTDAERSICLLEESSPERVAWHFIPKDSRKGLKFGDMKPQTRELAHTLVKSVLSEVGYRKAHSIMQLEGLLDALEKGRANRMIRDPERYYITFFGRPSMEKTWGLSFEGHHMSFNFSIAEGEITAHTPHFLGVNPGEVRKAVVPEFTVGDRLLQAEEQEAFELVNSLDSAQKEKGVIAAEAPMDVAGAGEAQPVVGEPQGIIYSALNESQKAKLKRIVDLCAATLTDDVAARDVAEIESAGWDKVYFAWAGALQPGIGHYYRIQGPTFIIEFCNNQPDAEGNRANHVHLQWRDPRGDFGVPIR